MGVVVLGYMLWVLATTENRRFIDGVLVFTYVHLGVGGCLVPHRNVWLDRVVQEGRPRHETGESIWSTPIA
ncbi:hypothetical protein MTO96_051635 [Rhipicephalus appendiculatus]